MVHPANPKVGIIDYSTGNILSVANALVRIGSEYIVVREPQDLGKCDAVIMPGVGHFHTAVHSLISTGLDHAIHEKSCSGGLILGICLGFQLLTQSSDESPHETGLGIFPTRTAKLDPIDTSRYKVPHIGWNRLKAEESFPSILQNINLQQNSFYFANKYAVLPMQGSSGTQAFYEHEKKWVAAASIRNVFGVQFHPEKSGKSGEALLASFLDHA